MRIDQLRRREFITLLGGAATWPLAARAQQQAGKVPRIGFLGLTSPSDRPSLLDAFRQGLRELEWVEGQNIVCLLYTSPSPRDISGSRMPSSA